MKKATLEKLNTPDKKITLYSENESQATSAFVLLNQLGVKNVYILKSGEGDDEEKRFSFQPDTTLKPETESEFD